MEVSPHWCTHTNRTRCFLCRANDGERASLTAQCCFGITGVLLSILITFLAPPAPCACPIDMHASAPCNNLPHHSPLPFAFPNNPSDQTRMRAGVCRVRCLWRHAYADQPFCGQHDAQVHHTGDACCNRSDSGLGDCRERQHGRTKVRD